MPVVSIIGIRQPSGQIICTFALNSTPGLLVQTFTEEFWSEDDINYMIALPVLNTLYCQTTENWERFGEYNHPSVGVLAGGKWFASQEDLSWMVASAYGENPLFSQMACLYDQKERQWMVQTFWSGSPQDPVPMRHAYFYPMGTTQRVEIKGYPTAPFKVLGYNHIKGKNYLLAETLDKQFCSFRITEDSRLEPDVPPGENQWELDSWQDD